MDFEAWAIGILGLLGLTAAFGVIWWGAGRVHEAMLARIETSKVPRRAALRIGQVRILGEGWLRGALRITSHVGQWTLRVLLVLVYVPLAIRVLPVAATADERILAFFLGTGRQVLDRMVAYFPALGRITVIVLMAWIVLRLLRFFFEELRKGRITLGRFQRSWARQTYNLVRFAVIVLVFIMVFPLLPGSGTEGFQGVAIFLGALISIGASSAVGNAVAGIVLTYTGAFERGDRVKLGETVGIVTDRTMFVTRVRTPLHEEVSVPNQVVLQKEIVNYSRDAKRGVAIEVAIGLGYDVPWRRAHELLLGAARQVDGVVADPPPRVWQAALDDFNVAYRLHAFTNDPPEMPALRSRLIQAVQDAFADAGVEILSPDHVALRDRPRPAERQVGAA